MSQKASPAMPWGQAETFHLIDAYEAQCLSLNRRQLKAHEWEIVAATVASRSGTGGPGQAPAKSSTQCRHKIEKLRKRFKAESARPVRSFWPFFERLSRITKSSDDEVDLDNDHVEVNKEDAKEDEVPPALSVAEVVKGFGDEVAKIEKRSIEIMREIERDRVEMERKREEMIMEAQSYLIKCIEDVSDSRPK